MTEISLDENCGRNVHSSCGRSFQWDSKLAISYDILKVKLERIGRLGVFVDVFLYLFISRVL